MLTEIVTTGSLAMLLLEVLKLIWRKLVIKDDTYDFPQMFYYVAIPVFNILLIPVMALMFPEAYVMPTDWVGFVRLTVATLVASLVSYGGYNVVLQPAKEYARSLAAKNG